MLSDTTKDKANVFKLPNVYLALSVWENVATLSYMVVGKNEKLGEYLEQKVENQIKKEYEGHKIYAGQQSADEHYGI